jgi:predicted transcriptional regulator
MQINYREAIKESPKELLKLEQKEKSAIVLKRLQLLRLLKSGQAKSMEEAAGIVGISTVQARRMWFQYKRAGLEIALICLKPGEK